MRKVTLLVPGMTCRHCVRTVTAALRDVPGVRTVQADLTTSLVVLHGEPAVSDILAVLDRARIPAAVMPAPPPHRDTGGTAATNHTGGMAAADGAVPG